MLPGHTLHPGGREPGWVKQAKAALREGSSEAADYLRSVVKDNDAATKDRLFAAKTVLEFTVPKPTQKLKVENKGSDILKDISAEMLERWAREDAGGSGNSGSA
jgi:hypothetical protein